MNISIAIKVAGLFIAKIMLLLICLMPFSTAHAEARPDKLPEKLPDKLTAKSESPLYQLGVEAFRAKRFNDALNYFVRAQTAGDARTQLQYNIAVSHFYLGEFNKAKRVFGWLIDDPALGDWARYNLAIIDEKQRAFKNALVGYQAVAATAKEKHLANLAAQKVTELTRLGRPEEKTSDGWIGSLGAGWGYDDNVIDPQDAAGSEQGDRYYEALLTLSKAWRVADPVSWQLELLGYASRFAEVDEYDVSLASISVSAAFKLAGWQIRTGVAGDYSTVSDDGFLRNAALDLSGRYTTSERGRVKLAYKFTDYDALSEQYEQLAGSGHRIEAKYYWLGTNSSRWELRYRLISEDRIDLSEVDSFRSYSPIRNGVRLRYIFTPGQFSWSPRHWEYAVSLGLRDSRYQDDEQFEDGTRLQRQDKRLSAAISTNYSWSKYWSANLELSYTDNESNISSFDYQRTSVLGGVTWSF